MGINFNNMFLPNIPEISTWHVLHILFHAKFLKSGVYFTLTHHNVDAKFSLELLDLYSAFIKCTVEKVDLPTKLEKTCFRVSLIADLSIHCQVNIN